ncbi:MAG: single-stranded DNA-binding protein [Parasporobacterium sp.]|nr:single-stranded DNA-binding protein [Parasporobacterium sp.]
MNKVILMGRLTRDPDIRYSQGENSMCVARFSLAVDRRFKRDGNDQTADFISCVAFGRTAEFFEKYLKQGSQICLEGRIQTGSYTNRDGQKVYTTDVVVENVEFAGSKPSGQSQSNERPAAPAQAYAQPAPAPAPAAPEEGFMSIPDGLEDEGLPFN